MKLDFSALAQPVARTWGQVGTTGTPASTRVCASPLALSGTGTTGDKPAAVAMVADLVIAAPVACPPVSPACPQGTDAETPNAGAVSPASPLVPAEKAQGVAAAPFEREDAAGQFTGAGINTCFAQRLAFRGNMPTVAADRPYRLTIGDADRCHTPGWDDAEIAAFVARHARLIRFGLADQDADDLAETLTLRDREGDDRHMCCECRDLTQAGRCSAAARGDMPGVSRQMEPIPDILRHCANFGPTVSAHRDSQGIEDASHHD